MLNHNFFFRYSLIELATEIQHGYSIKHDALDNVDYMRTSIKSLEIKNLSIIEAHQQHKDKIIHVTDANQYQLFECDGFMTQEKNLILNIKHADCQAALFYDPKRAAIANIHCGWRGHILNIYQKCIKQMREVFGSDPQDILVCISPSLGPNRSEFIHYKNEFPKSFWKFFSKNNTINLWELARYQLEREGIKPENIEIASLCTYDHPKLFYSYRRDKTTKRNISFIKLN